MSLDRHTIVTPEGVTLDLPLAGVGSRGVATVIDAIIRAAALAAVSFAADWADLQLGAPVLLTVATVVVFLIVFGYDIAFEVANGGRTPGKAAVGLRVVRVGGAPVGLIASTIRNLLRLVDFLPFAYLVGMVAATANDKAQRLGDLAAGTIVVRESRRPGRRLRRRAEAQMPAPVPAPPGWDLSAVDSSDLAAIRAFIQRRDALDPRARDRIAARLYGRLEHRIVRPPGHDPPERVLEVILADKLHRS